MTASSTSVNIPTCLWAQRKDCVYVTVDIPDATDEKISVDANLIKFSAKSKDKLYECEMELFDEIDAEESKYIVRGRNVFFSLARKKDDSKSGDDEVYWPRLLKDKNLQKRFVKCDFDKWVDEDEEDGADKVDTSQMQGMGGMGGMGGGAGGMDMAAMQQMMAGMGGAGGAGGAGGMDMAAMQKMMAGMGGAGGAPTGMGGDDEPDSDDDVEDLDDMPELE